MKIAPSIVLPFAIALLLGTACAGRASAQATVDNGAATAAQIATRLQGPGISITGANIPAANGSDTTTMYGLYSNGISGAGLQINRGVALSTGTIAEMFTSNSAPTSSIGVTTTYNDPDLTAIESGAYHNVAVITMNVTLDPGVVGMEFRYQFGSDEYPDYVGSTFNDLFAILISGPGITGRENIAILPSGDRTDVNSINYGIRGCNQNGAPLITSNNPFYIRNGHVTTVGSGGNLNCNPAPQPGPFPVVMEWNGLTTALTARKTGLTPGATYQVKIAVADVLDQQYDSGAVFDVISGIFNRDYGDAPNTGGYGEPSHDVVAGLYLGQPPTVEASGYNSSTATGDVDDGVVLSALSGGNTSTLNINAVGPGGYLQAWFDWNADGDFNDSGEQVGVNLQDSNSDSWITLPVTPPATSTTYDTFARFRWSTTANLSPTATATDGEVEDYQVTVSSAASALMCPSGMTPISSSGNAIAVISTPPGATNPGNALGPLFPAGAGLGLGNAAHLTATTTTLGLDLGVVVPQNATITVSLARDDAAGIVAIDTSIDGSAWSQQLTFNGGVDDIAQRISLVVPAGSARYLRFRRLAGNAWIDGVHYTSVCQGVPELQGSKSVVVYDPDSTGIYALPGNDVIYAITVANTGSLATDADTVVVIDEVPDEMIVFTGLTPEFGGQVVGFSQTGSALTFSPVTDLGWSNNLSRPANFAACNYLPVTDYDPAITYICVNPKGVMAAGSPDPQFTVSFRARIR